MICRWGYRFLKYEIKWLSIAFGLLNCLGRSEQIESLGRLYGIRIAMQDTFSILLGTFVLATDRVTADFER